jgi:hypothetical protein
MNSEANIEREFREMTTAEQALIGRLLEDSFPGSEQLSAQVKTCLVRSIDENGSLDFIVSVDQKAAVYNSVPVEAEAEDVDGVTIHILLHVIDGVAQGLEVYKEDLSRVIEFPAPAKLSLFSPR